MWLDATDAIVRSALSLGRHFVVERTRGEGSGCSSLVSLHSQQRQDSSTAQKQHLLGMSMSKYRNS